MKDRYYFKHDYHARNDDKIEIMLLDYKAAGYGLYWAVVEKLHEENGSMVWTDLTTKIVAKHIGESPEFVSKFIDDCVNIYKLLYIEDGAILTSKRVKLNLAERERVSNVRKDAAKRSRRVTQNDANALKENANADENDSKCSDFDSGKEKKERKGKEIKENKPNGNFGLGFSSSSHDSNGKQLTTAEVELPEHLR